ncbi:MAG: carboxypeptidase-like regulatory domain-containing protein, partial [Terracidiphilus sp.]|nr:carboxypeptidase-like regulatory domain-containing protein [Terracidiphilus sp.]
MMFVCIFSTGAFAQNDVSTIVGVIADQSGAVIPNASVVLTNEGTLQSRTVLSDASGRYTAPNLAPAIYTVSVTATGFQKYVSAHNTLRSNSTAEIDAKLAIGAATQTVQVTDTAQVLETQSSTVQSQVTGSQIIKLELNGRNPIMMTQFNPGVTGTTTLGDFNWSMTSGDSFNINGARS